MTFFRINGKRYTTEEDFDLDLHEPEIRELGNLSEDAVIYLEPRDKDEKREIVKPGTYVFLGTVNGLECSFTSEEE